MTIPKPTTSLLSILDIRAQLWRCGYPSMSQWGRVHGFSPRMVSYTLNKWIGRNDDTLPLGHQTKAILWGVSQTIGQPIHPKIKLPTQSSSIATSLTQQQPKREPITLKN